MSVSLASNAYFHRFNEEIGNLQTKGEDIDWNNGYRIPVDPKNFPEKLEDVFDFRSIQGNHSITASFLQELFLKERLLERRETCRVHQKKRHL